MTDKFWMQQAFDLAVRAGGEGEVPVGAVLVDCNNKLLGSGRNSSIKAYDPSAHAEVNAIREAAAVLANHRLLDTTLYVTLEPCAMCAGLLVQARIKRLVFASRDFNAGAAGSVFNLVQGYPLNHRIVVDEGVMQHECSALLADFFKLRR